MYTRQNHIDVYRLYNMICMDCKYEQWRKRRLTRRWILLPAN